jgi:hypothetical protein
VLLLPGSLTGGQVHASQGHPPATVTKLGVRGRQPYRCSRLGSARSRCGPLVVTAQLASSCSVAASSHRTGSKHLQSRAAAKTCSSRQSAPLWGSGRRIADHGRGLAVANGGDWALPCSISFSALVASTCMCMRPWRADVGRGVERRRRPLRAAGSARWWAAHAPQPRRPSLARQQLLRADVVGNTGDPSGLCVTCGVRQELARRTFPSPGRLHGQVLDHG